MILEHSNPHTVYNKHKDLMQSGNSKTIQHMVLTLPIGLLFLDQWHNTCEVTNFTERRMQKSIFCHDNCKNLAKMKQVHQGAVGLCPKIMTREKIALHFMLLWLSFRLWVWHREPHFLSSLLFLFIVIYAVLFHNQKLSFCVVYMYICRSLKFNICGPDHKICIYIENGLFPQLFETYCIAVYTVVERVCDIKYCVIIYTALV